MSRVGRWVWRAVRGFLTVKLGVAILNLYAFPVLHRQPRPAGVGRVSILVPARNEASTLPLTLPALLAQGADEVLVLDDHSDDGTADVARALGARVLTGEALPPGWHGKPWACQQLARAACGDVLVFTDADVFWQPGTLDALLAERARTGAELLTVWPRQRTGTWGERLLVPMIDDLLLSGLPHPFVRLPFAPMAAGNGQLMLFERDAYTHVGGHALVRGEVLEDVRFAVRFKARGGRLGIALGGDLLGVRMYSSYGEAVRGFGKSVLDVHGRSRWLMLLTGALHVAAYSAPWFAGRPLLIGLGLLGPLLVRAKTGRTRPRDLAEVALTPLLPLAALPVYLMALRGRYTWKGRTYQR